MRTGAIFATATFLAAVAWLFLARSGSGVDLDTQTFELQYLELYNAVDLIQPYVYADRPDAPGQVSAARNLLTVRETADNLEKVARVLQQYDTAPTSVQLQFQIIEANGASETDPVIANVESVLRQLFRFQGYRLSAEAMMGGVEGSRISQVLGSEAQYRLEAHIQSVRTAGDSGVVRLVVVLGSNRSGAVFETSANVRFGQTMVLGSTQPDPRSGTIILTVRPEIVGN
jgi:type II secretory pathway component GspD/PulD (secretin)